MYYCRWTHSLFHLHAKLGRINGPCAYKEHICPFQSSTNVGVVYFQEGSACTFRVLAECDGAIFVRGNALMVGHNVDLPLTCRCQLHPHNDKREQTNHQHVLIVNVPWWFATNLLSIPTCRVIFAWATLDLDRIIPHFSKLEPTVLQDGDLSCSQRTPSCTNQILGFLMLGITTLWVFPKTHLFLSHF